MRLDMRGEEARFAPNGRWGLRGDYRLEIVNGKNDAPPFFGQEPRYGQRI